MFKKAQITDSGWVPQVSQFWRPGNTPVTSSRPVIYHPTVLLATYSADHNPTQNVAGILNFYIDDPLGTRRHRGPRGQVFVRGVVVMTDYAGNTAETCHSLPYGNGEDCAATPAEHLFTQHERDAETGNDYFGARYYASSMGRFLTPDWSAKVEPVPYSKLDDPQTLNLYAYVGNNPFIRLDADGNQTGSGGPTFADNAEANAEATKKNQLVPRNFTPSAPPLAVVTTSISGGTTSLTISTHEKTKTTTWKSLTKVDSAYQRKHPAHTWIGRPLRADIVRVETGAGVADTRAYGPKGAAISTDDPHGQWIHGGGRESDSQQPNQTLIPTYGCTRMHNQDVITLGQNLTQFRQDHPESGPALWNRTK
ncbi:MAG: RHS repeat-associated core domain-containing protein [Acidobacteriota bacterium]